MVVLDPGQDYVVLINTFSVDPDRADELLAFLSEATENGMRHRPGFVSASLHMSDDRRHVANYAQWRSRDDIDAMMRDDAARQHMSAAAAIATSFEPIYYKLHEAHSA